MFRVPALFSIYFATLSSVTSFAADSSESLAFALSPPPLESSHTERSLVPLPVSLDLFLACVQRGNTSYSATYSDLKWTTFDTLRALGFVGLKILETPELWKGNVVRAKVQPASQPFERWTIIPDLGRFDRLSFSFAMEI